MGIAGFILWQRGHQVDTISLFSWKERSVWAIIALIAIAATYAGLKGTNNPLPLLDSISSVTSVIATWFMFRHKLEAWVVWLINDLFYIAEYMMLPDKAIYLICLYIIWTFLAAASYINWRRLLRASAHSLQ